MEIHVPITVKFHTFIPKNSLEFIGILESKFLGILGKFLRIPRNFQLHFAGVPCNKMIYLADLNTACIYPFVFQVQTKIAWNVKGGYISGFTMAPDGLPVSHDVFTSAIQSECQKASYIVQFLWRNLTSGYKLIGPCFPISSSVDSNIPQEFFLLSLKVLSNYGFIISIVLCGGASSNLTLLKLL